MNNYTNHGKVGEALCIKLTVDKFNEKFRTKQNIKDGDYFTPEKAEKLFRVCTSVPIKIDNNTQGNYECICEFGVEVH